MQNMGLRKTKSRTVCIHEIKLQLVTRVIGDDFLNVTGNTKDYIYGRILTVIDSAFEMH